MLKKTFVLLFAFGLLFGASGSAVANHTPGHKTPPSCPNPNNGPNDRHCYPAPGGQEPAACSKPSPPKQCNPASFTAEAPTQSGAAITVGMVLLAGAVGSALLLLRRRWTGWLRRS